MDYVALLGVGMLAGLALAVPLGAIGVLLVQEGSSRGLLLGLPAAFAVATVDMLYCVAALAAGSLLSPIIATLAPWPAVVGGLVLIAMAIFGLFRVLTARKTSGASTPVMSHGRGWGRYALFFGLTAINPATLLYFAAIATGLSTLTSSPLGAGLFVLGVTVASLTWQSALVLLGSALRWRHSARRAIYTGVIGNGTVGVPGALMIFGSLSSAA